MSTSDGDPYVDGDPSSARDVFAWLSREVHALTGPIVPRISTPTPLGFLRNFVSANRPCVVQGAFDHWPARTRWTTAYLRRAMGTKDVSVNVTPDGRGDALLSTAGWSVEGGEGKSAATEMPGTTQEDWLFVGGLPYQANEAEVMAQFSRWGRVTNVWLARDKNKTDVCKGFGFISYASKADAEKVRALEKVTFTREESDGISLTVDVDVRTATRGIGKTVYRNVVRNGKKPREVFVMPEERRMPFGAFLDMLDGTRASKGTQPSVPYVSRQNGSLTEEFPELAGDCAGHLDWASEAFGCRPEAVNLWCGDERAHTTFHRDHYENIYCVIAGTKTFTLLPPADGHRLRHRKAPAAVFKHLRGQGAAHPGDSATVRTGFALQLEQPPRLVSWSSASPADLRGADGLPPAITVTVGPGEALYLPAMWYHHVSQSRGPGGEPALAVNYWYDMQFDDRFAYANFAEEAHRRFGESERKTPGGPSHGRGKWHGPSTEM